jgi:hypothetical protein
MRAEAAVYMSAVQPEHVLCTLPLYSTQHRSQRLTSIANGDIMYDKVDLQSIDQGLIAALLAYQLLQTRVDWRECLWHTMHTRGAFPMSHAKAAALFWWLGMSRTHYE